ncbi:MAG: glutathione S-transferase family protein [Marinibacterium sp.]
MADLGAFPITHRWPPANPDVIQLYAYPTPNGVKASIALEELGLPYEAHKINLSEEDLLSPEFLSLNPNNKIPAIIDPDGPDGAPFGLFESGAILIYLAEKTGKLIGDSPRQRYQILQWLMFQMGGVGPMFGQLGFFWKFAGKAIEDPRPRQRYLEETARLLEVLDEALDGRDWICGDYSIADIAIAPWLRALDFYGAREAVDWEDCENVVAYLERFLNRPAVQVGLVTPPRD